jgi:toxin ParE1/3/4
MPKIILSEFVEPELAVIWDYIALDNPNAADDVIEAIHATMADLSKMPDLGRLRHFSQTRLVNLRSLSVKGYDNYLIFYSPIVDGIEVFHVLHGARDIGTFFGEK